MPEQFAVDLLDQFKIPFGFRVGGVELGGLTGLAYNPDEDVYYAIADAADGPEGSTFGGPTRFYTLGMKIDQRGFFVIDLVGQTLVRVS